MSLDCLAEADTAIKDQTHPLRDRPLVDVTVGNQPPRPLATKYEELQAKLLYQPTDRKRVGAENSSHFVIIDRPDMVIDAITQVVDSVGSKSKLSNIRLHAILAIENSYKYS